MKKLTVFILAAALAVFVGSWPGQMEQVAYAAPHGGGGHGGGHGGGGHGGGRGAGGFVGGGHHGGGHHGGGHFGVWVGPGWGWDPFFYPYYPYYPYPYYNTPTVVVPQQPEEYVMPESQPEETSYWYFCKDPKGYYPYVKSCPGGWMKVVPAPAPPGEED
jgi:hypothetical protein